MFFKSYLSVCASVFKTFSVILCLSVWVTGCSSLNKTYYFESTKNSDPLWSATEYEGYPAIEIKTSTGKLTIVASSFEKQIVVAGPCLFPLIPEDGNYETVNWLMVIEGEVELAPDAFKLFDHEDQEFGLVYLIKRRHSEYYTSPERKDPLNYRRKLKGPLEIILLMEYDIRGRERFTLHPAVVDKGEILPIKPILFTRDHSYSYSPFTIKPAARYGAGCVPLR